MDYQPHKSRKDRFLNFLSTNGIALAYFLGSQQDLGPRLLAGEEVVGAPESDLDLGVVLLEHPLDYWEGQRLRQRLEAELAPLFAPIPLHLLLLEEENAHVQYAAIRGLPVYAISEEVAREYRVRVLTLYGDWHSWWP
jgi:predicted nucleotidyltransferase